MGDPVLQRIGRGGGHPLRQEACPARRPQIVKVWGLIHQLVSGYADDGGTDPAMEAHSRESSAGAALVPPGCRVGTSDQQSITVPDHIKQPSGRMRTLSAPDATTRPQITAPATSVRRSQ